jgi:transcriptional regulator with XRE-family HTH domain
VAQSIGDRIRTMRKLRDLSTRQAAGLAGISQSTWSRIENGERSADNRHVLAAIAQALQCSTADLTGQSPAPTDRGSARVASAVHRTVQALLDTDLDLPGTVTAPRPLAVLAEEADAIQQLGLACRYADAAGRLPDLLREAHAHLRGPDRESALRTLAAAARWSMVTLKCLGRATEAWVAADRSHEAATALGDPVVLGVAAWSRGHAATSCGAYSRAVAVATAGLETLRDCDLPQAAQVRGSLHLLAGWAEWGLGHADEGDTLIGQATRIAHEVGDPGDDPYGLVFGPTNVGLWKLSAAVEAGETGRAIEISAGLSPGTLPISRQAALYLDLGRALADIGDTDRAVRTLLQAERVGPERVHQSPLARETVRGLVEQARRRDQPALTGLAERLNLTTD